MTQQPAGGVGPSAGGSWSPEGWHPPAVPGINPPPGRPAHPTGVWRVSLPTRPSYREPFPITTGPLLGGILGGTAWMTLFGVQATSGRAYAWLTISAALIAQVAALGLARFGDRGAAVGVAASGAVGLAVAVLVVLLRWSGGDWLLW